VFTAKGKDGRVSIVTLYVDDLIITGNWNEKVVEIIAELEKEFSKRLPNCSRSENN
jgi:hypothetical protein